MQQLDLATIFRQAVADHRAGRLQPAEAGYRRVLEAAPGHADSLHYLGLIAAQVGRHDLAADLIARAVAVRPVMPDYSNNLGLSLTALGRFGEAADAFRRAIALAPDLAEAHSNLGNALRSLGRPAEAELSYRRALQLAPDLAPAHNNLGAALADLDRLDEAEQSYRQALRCNPVYPEAYNNLANAVRGQGHWRAAIEYCREAVALAPDYAEAHYNLGWALLLTGDFAEGWPEFEWRWRVEGGAGTPGFGVPLWRGEPLEDRTLLLHAEQGAGDSFMFCRYAERAAKLGRVLLVAPPALVGLFKRLSGLAGVFAAGAELPPFDLHCPLLSLPLAFGTTLDSVPDAVPYLAADPGRVAIWRDRLRTIEGPRVGLVWAGNPAQRDDRRRSMTLADLAPLATLPALNFISLQKGRAETPPAGMRFFDWTEELQDYDDTAALIETLDLVLAVDTGVAHLAGALGRPVWLMNRFEPYFAWLTEREDSPWYPTLRQFRQNRAGEWGPVVESVRKALALRSWQTTALGGG
ncbi:MAG: tetratricopeptide repeat-containing glycosyltransferase family protein [Aliidongia sp.]